jgi:hypothetical protein
VTMRWLPFIVVAFVSLPIGGLLGYAAYTAYNTEDATACEDGVAYFAAMREDAQGLPEQEVVPWVATYLQEHDAPPILEDHNEAFLALIAEFEKTPLNPETIALRTADVQQAENALIAACGEETDIEQYLDTREAA